MKIKSFSEKIMTVVSLHGEILNDLTEFLDNVEKNPPDVNLALQFIEIEEQKISSYFHYDVDDQIKILKNLYYPQNENKNISSDSELLKMRGIFECLNRFITLYFYESGSYLRPILSELFPALYLRAAINMEFGECEIDEATGIETFIPDTVNLYHSDVFDYLETVEEMTNFIRKLWVVSYIKLKTGYEPAILDILDLLESIDKYAVKIK